MAATRPEQPVSLRARKKLRTRQTIVEVGVLRGITEVWGSWYQQHVTDAIFDPGDALQLKADHLRSALPSALELIAALPSAPDWRLEIARRRSRLASGFVVSTPCEPMYTGIGPKLVPILS
jgi:hypothetical protein